jgi:hypothetical protein
VGGNPPVLYWIGRASEMHPFVWLLHENDRFVKVGEIELLREPDKEARRSRDDRRRRDGRRFGIAPGTKLELFKLERKKSGD